MTQEINETQQIPAQQKTGQGIDSSATLQQAAGLAAHLQRIGVQWLPTPVPGNVQVFAEQFEFAPTTEPPASEQVAVALQKSTANSAASTSPATPQRSGSAAALTKESSQDQPTPATANRLAGPDTATAKNYPGQSLPLDDRKAALAGYRDQAAACTRCEVLAKCRTKTVFGEGSPDPRVVFFGEAPGRDEDLSGQPFVGKAGQLLTKMIQACKFDRDDVYILNSVKCRPPNNRNPESAEIENCREFFEAQLNLLRPEYIVCLGLISSQALLRTKLSVGKLRGKFHRHFESKVLVTYHPSYLLRAPAAKKAAWDDLQMMLRDAGLL